MENEHEVKALEKAGMPNAVDDTAEEDNFTTVAEYLDYERQMFLDMLHADALMVCAKGLHHERVLLHILKVYSNPANLVLVINSSEWEERHYKSKLKGEYVHEVSNTATERERVYLEGGVQFITARILVVDILKNRVPIELITGIIVLRAHNIVESCQEAFALRLYRHRNKTGFIKAFSSNVEAFTMGYGHIERTMRNLFVKELFIWPRFHATVQASLQPYESQTIELHIAMTPTMTMLQTHILDIMNYLVREIKRINRSLDLEEITVENCVTKKFHKILQSQLDCIWHQLNSQTKLIVADLKVLRSLMISIMYHDAVSAYVLIKRYRSIEYAISNSGWTLLDAAEQIFKISKQRVFNEDGDFEPEPCPKWKHLSEILKVEIPADMERSRPDSFEPPKVLLLCSDTRTCYQLKQFLTQSGERFLLHTALRHQLPIKKLGKSFENDKNSKQLEANIASLTPQKIGHGSCSQKFDFSQKVSQELRTQGLSTNEAKLESVATGGVQDELTQLLAVEADDNLDDGYLKESYMLTMTQQHLNNSNLAMDDSIESTGKNMETSIFESFPELDNLDIRAAVAACRQPLICLQTFKTESEGAMALDRILEEINPQYVIMYHCNVTAIRQLESYEARQKRSASERMKVFFLIHARTVEEQSYLTSLRREKQAFEMIIETKRTMVIPEYQDGKSDEAFLLFQNYRQVSDENASSRKAGGQDMQTDKNLVPKIIVDMREFRSDLPCLLHKRGIEVLPVTITIGDYILTPEICVERKSISDLIGSLNSGRLYNQCIQMQRYYAKSMLLIEFDQNKPFHLQGKYMLSQNTSATQTDIVQKLQLLTLHFPKLRLIWSPSPYATAQLFDELKLGKEEPDAENAAAVGSDDLGGGAYDDLKFNANIYDFLLRLPGVNTRNVHRVMRYGGSMPNLLKKSQAELSDLLVSEANGLLLWDILHVAHLPQKDEVQGSTALLAASKQFANHSRFRRGAAKGGAHTHRGRYKP